MIQIKEEFKERVQFEFFGARPSFADRIDAKCIPYCYSYDAYRKRLNELEWDIGLAPMPDTSFHACKHYNKYIEYGAAGVIGIFSKCEPYVRLENKDAVLLTCENESSIWKSVLRKMITECELRENLRKRVTEDINKNFSLPIVARVFENSLIEVAEEHPNQNEIHNNLIIYKVFNVLDWLSKIVRKLGRVLRHNFLKEFLKICNFHAL